MDYQKIANVFKYLHDRMQEAGTQSQINGLIFNHADLQYNKDYIWYAEGSKDLYERVMVGLDVIRMRHCLVNNGYVSNLSEFTITATI